MQNPGLKVRIQFVQQCTKLRPLLLRSRVISLIEVVLEYVIEFKQPAPALPAQALFLLGIGFGQVLNGVLEHQILDVADGLGGVEILRARLDTVHDGMAAEQLVRSLELIEAMLGGLVTAIGEEAPRRQ